MCEGTVQVPALQRVTPFLPYFRGEHNSSGSVHKPVCASASGKKVKKAVFSTSKALKAFFFKRGGGGEWFQNGTSGGKMPQGLGGTGL